MSERPVELLSATLSGRSSNTTIVFRLSSIRYASIQKQTNADYSHIRAYFNNDIFVRDVLVDSLLFQATGKYF